ncbi:hypothetical protein LS70_008510 [Helicobacter sp. MIT 11-5569]|uniref:GNAT family N-acetyltransferase n=1 Tax=Helicobacter sp. MIT 11-5569 TaxID=1548151 RepID=UPI00051F98B0|nr:hypothetical protein [Helicobacter sp. MIT 11-5569]TLD81161.1 hypothetical protein LS70_008510 [Helicobacter sp. MIT 11-5569]
MRNLHNFSKIEGRYINLREAEISDSAFILDLRTNEKKSKFIHKTDGDLQKQIAYMERYKSLDNEWYFVIEDKQGKPIGLNSIYPTYNTFVIENNLAFYEFGRWIMQDGVNFLQSLESDFLVKKTFYESLNLDDKNVFTLYPANTQVLDFHLKAGAVDIGFDEKEKLKVLMLTREAYEQSKKKVFSLLNR